jgi:hypothetical protein
MLKVLPATIIEVTLPVPMVYPIANIPGPKPNTKAIIFLMNDFFWVSVSIVIYVLWLSG